MSVDKKHDEFYTLDMPGGWKVPVGHPKGIQQKILSADRTLEVERSRISIKQDGTMRK
jgi:hypothetical protein